MSQSKQSGNQSLERLELRNKPTLIITQKLQHQIDFLHQKVGGNEWSGELITREEGKITDMEDWKVIAEDIWLADIGTGTFTGYEVDKGGFKAVDIVDMYEAFPGLMEGTQKNHHIHTHHNMGAFFSGTDWENLTDRALQSNYFIMLVVDFKKEYKAKVAFKAEIKGGGETTINFANNHDELPAVVMSKEREREVLVVMDMEVKFQGAECVVGDDFKKRFEDVELAVTQEKANKYLNTRSISYGSGSHTNYGRGYGKNTDSAGTSSVRQPGFNWGDAEDWREEFDQYKKNRRGSRHKDKKSNRKDRGPQKRISEMTDKEYKEFEKENDTGHQCSLPQGQGFEIRHATAIINAIIDKESGLNFTEIQNRLFTIDSFQCKFVHEKAVWVENFMLSFPDYMELLFPEKSDKQGMVGMMNKLIEKLYPYKYLSIVRMLIDELSLEVVNLAEQSMQEQDEALNNMIQAEEMAAKLESSYGDTLEPGDSGFIDSLPDAGSGEPSSDNSEEIDINSPLGARTFY